MTTTWQTRQQKQKPSTTKTQNMLPTNRVRDTTMMEDPRQIWPTHTSYDTARNPTTTTLRNSKTQLGPILLPTLDRGKSKRGLYDRLHMEATPRVDAQHSCKHHTNLSTPLHSKENSLQNGPWPDMEQKTGNQRDINYSNFPRSTMCPLC